MAPAFSSFLACVLTLFCYLTTAIPHQGKRATLPPMFLLAGDSTTRGRSGWGDGFILKTLQQPASGINYGVYGASMPSYRAEGHWSTVLSQVAAYKSTNSVFVTIQFGHNDQRVKAYEDAYSANLQAFVSDVNTAGGTPIVITPITRRNFSGCCVIQDLAVETAKALTVAQATGSMYIDLNGASTGYVNAIGSTAAHRYNLVPSDDTHLNRWGGVVFGRLVSDLLVAKYGEIKAYTVANSTLSAELANGIPA